MTDLDVVARAAVERARREVTSVDVPAAQEVTARRTALRRHRRGAVAVLATLIVAGGVFVVAATRGSDPSRPGVAVAPATAPARRRASATLQFREVYSVKDFNGCRPTADHPRTRVVVPERGRNYCYELGPVILDGTNVESAAAFVSPTTSQWEVDVHFRNDDFVNKVAVPYADKQVAIVVDGVAESAPTINPGITGNDVTTSGAFTRADAENLARALTP